jgi:F420-dependent oxidoreductase-like protein
MAGNLPDPRARARPWYPDLTTIRERGAVMRKLGLQQPNYKYGGGTERIFPTLLAQAKEAEAAGFDVFYVMDHLCQPADTGPPTDPVLESQVTMAALAASTERIHVGTLVSGNPYRNPALLARMVTSLDVISGGRAVLGIGAGWMELEHHMYGYSFEPLKYRYEMLAEAMQIIRAMLRGERLTLRGKWFSVEDAVNEPRVRDDLPLVMGGSGEKKSFGLAARYADEVNFGCIPAVIPRKLEALEERCAEVGRARSTLKASYIFDIVLGERPGRAQDTLRQMHRAGGMFAPLGIDPDDPQEFAKLLEAYVVGTPDEVSDQVKRFVRPGIDGFIVKVLPNMHVPGMLELAGSIVRPQADQL